MNIIYRPLQQKNREIRILDLDSAAALDDPLRGTLRQVKLHEASYVALSYVWGDSERNRSSIAVKYEQSARKYLAAKLHGSSDRYDHSIGASLTAALRYLRQKYGSISIWTDALCIDQSNAEEKSWQVSLMTSIYSEAKEVHAWLGPSHYDGNKNLDSTIHASFDLADVIWGIAMRIGRSNTLLNEDSWLEACIAVSSPREASHQARLEWSDFSIQLRQAALADSSVWNGFTSIRSLSQIDYFARMWFVVITRAEHMVLI